MRILILIILGQVTSIIIIGTLRSSNIVLLTELLDLSQDTETTLWWDQTADDLLSYILGTSPQQIFELDAREFLDDSALL